MPQSKILIDTNSYIRLAQSLHPLLSKIFGNEEYCLYIIKELNEELGSNRLSNKFPWVHSDEYIENRSNFPSIGRKAKKAIDNNFEYIWEYVTSDLPGPSKVDALYIASAMELGIPVVTDDCDMTELAEVFDVQTMTTMRLLKLMCDSSHITIGKVKGITDYWIHLSDCPAKFNSELKKFFPTIK
ncbi:MAG: DNA-binding protein [Cycloclasticus sp.]|nr:DNA-binding protein [Cycloclasticus sp.]